MAERILENFKSRRNSACLVCRGEERLVVKTFAQEAPFQKELQIYKMLQEKNIPCARVISAENKTLVLSQLPGKTLLECLEQQEQTGRPVWQIWEQLVAWLIGFWRHTGLVMTDVNLRNFIYDEDNRVVYGLDFEECCPGSPEIPAAGVAAFVRTYAPANTLLKQEISRYILKLFAQQCEMEEEALVLESKCQETKILERRKNRI